MQDRWIRLQRFAEFKQNKFRLLGLPDDVLRYLCMNFLDPKDLYALVDAVAEEPVTLSTPRILQLKEMPCEVRSRWLLASIIKEVERRLHVIADECLFLAHQCTQLNAFVDWSPFKSRRHRTPAPVAVYSWHSDTRPHGRVDINYKVLLNAISNSLRTHRPFGYLAIYMCYHCEWNMLCMMPRPVFSTEVPLIPYWGIASSFYEECATHDVCKGVRAEVKDAHGYVTSHPLVGSHAPQRGFATPAPQPPPSPPPAPPLAMVSV